MWIFLHIPHSFMLWLVCPPLLTNILLLAAFLRERNPEGDYSMQPSLLSSVAIILVIRLISLKNTCLPEEKKRKKYCCTFNVDKTAAPKVAMTKRSAHFFEECYWIHHTGMLMCKIIFFAIWQQLFCRVKYLAQRKIWYSAMSVREPNHPIWWMGALPTKLQLRYYPHFQTCRVMKYTTRLSGKNLDMYPKMESSFVSVKPF